MRTTVMATVLATVFAAGMFGGVPPSTAAPLVGTFPQDSLEAHAARQLATVPDFHNVTATEYALNKARESGRQAERLRVINYRRSMVGVPEVPLDPVAEMVAHTAAEVFRDWNTRLATQWKPPHPQEGKCVVRLPQRDDAQSVWWGGRREYCYRPFVIRNSPVRSFAYWVSRVSLGEQLFSRDVVAAGISGAPRQVSLLGEKDDLVVVVLKTREKQHVLEAERPWESGLVQILAGYVQQIQQGKTPQEIGDEAARHGVMDIVLAPLYRYALQRAFVDHGVKVEVQSSTRAQMWADGLAATVKKKLEGNTGTPERVAYDVAQLSLLINVYSPGASAMPYKQHVFITPAWTDIFTVFRNINAGDSIFREAKSNYGITPVALGNGTILWIIVSEK